MSPVARDDEVVLRRGDQRAVVTLRGAAVREYVVGGRDVIVSFPAGEAPPGMHGAVLAPWPNRLADGRFEFAGRVHQVPVTEPGRGNANHGLVHALDWEVTDLGDDHVTLGIDLDDEGFGFPLRLAITHRLDDEGLVVSASARNVGSGAAPFGIGFHPWLSPGPARVDECRLQVDAEGWLRTDERMLPVGAEAIPRAKDFREPRLIGDAVLDDGFLPATFADQPGGPARSWVRVASPDGCTAAAWAEAPLSVWQVCTGDFDELGSLRRAGVAAEPMSCPANALVTGDRLAVIEPGSDYTVRWGLCLAPDA